MGQEHYEKQAVGLLKSYGAELTTEKIQDLRERLSTEFNNGYQNGFDQCGQQIRELIGS